MFYLGITEQFLEAVLSIPEKARGLTQEAVGDPTRDAAAVVGQRRNRPSGLHAPKF
jgi:hypothetical protein